MRIGLDARTLYAPQARGTGRNLRDVLRRFAPAYPDDSILLFHRGAPHARADGDSRDWRSAPGIIERRLECPGDRFDLWLHLRLPLAAWLERVDVLHTPANAAPLWCRVPLVVTIHDLIPLSDAADGEPGAALTFERAIRRTLRVAAHVVTPSRFTRAALISRFGLDPDRITVVPWAPDSQLTQTLPTDLRAAEDRRVRDTFALDAPWILNFSGRSRRKNARGLIAAFAALPPQTCARALLVLTGVASASARTALLEFAHAHGVAPRCRVLGFLPAADVAALLRGALGVAMPSLAEGFGLPVLDAMACGIPVLASNCTSLPEVAGDAAIYVDPRDVADIRDGLLELVSERGRTERVERGLTRAAEFTWEKTAAALHGVYERCARTRAADMHRHPAPEGAP